MVSQAKKIRRSLLEDWNAIYKNYQLSVELGLSEPSGTHAEVDIILDPFPQFFLIG